ncbi:hypothetical protein M752DRAFT_117119 [Aspergillus phoenicis ATCC 13157]|uniref:Uncharacterized protein n=1 Tax=Aspergillus phoenicis ATCC 13157 TaxID=1353007 RepID=A0A370PTM1_ASPPH|nr:hypothetical protein M752DRAFT_117119 [Aspergillus phoenicis ATCC 13157]
MSPCFRFDSSPFSYCRQVLLPFVIFITFYYFLLSCCLSLAMLFHRRGFGCYQSAGHQPFICNGGGRSVALSDTSSITCLLDRDPRAQLWQALVESFGGFSPH